MLQLLEGADVHAGAYTDDAQNSESITAGHYFDIWYNSDVTSSNFAANNLDGNPWGQFFQGVRKCNVFIANIDGATAEITNEERAGWKAQALTLRAWYYLQLMKRFGQLPLITSDLGTSHDYTADKKASVSEIAAQILADCDAAIATEDSDAYSYVYRTQQWGMATKALAQAIRCETATYVISPLFSDGGYTADQALDIAADALAKVLANDYSLWTTASGGYNAYASYFLYNLMITGPRTRRQSSEACARLSGKIVVFRLSAVAPLPAPALRRSSWMPTRWPTESLLSRATATSSTLSRSSTPSLAMMSPSLTRTGILVSTLPCSTMAAAEEMMRSPLSPEPTAD